ncbi:MaoC family dehydratase N-terminal domain-containing protein [Nocardioides sp. LHD-245]|uniref:FAS1-like dehydratase domain-containing protein n=1 Tax=Nocardioides sp. LHD-245 TaxID=3051387 RepID=UPI0027DF51B9|nr:MaoC family dehydratase N-terminal domain-containing protein [Nocardioides sp. LHD-245]
MSDQARIHEVWTAARSRLGATRRVELGRIGQQQLDRFAVAVDGSVADDVVGLAAPLFLSSVLVWDNGPLERDLLPDGNAADPFSGFDVAGLRLMAGGQELTFHRDLEAGALVSLDIALAGAELKTTANGPLLVLTVQRTYSDEDGPLSECRETFLGREALS